MERVGRPKCVQKVRISEWVEAHPDWDVSFPMTIIAGVALDGQSARTNMLVVKLVTLFGVWVSANSAALSFAPGSPSGRNS